MNGHWSYIKVFDKLSRCQFLLLFFSQWYTFWCPGKTVLILMIYCWTLVRKKNDKHLIKVISRTLLLFSLLPSEMQLLMFSLLIYAFIWEKIYNIFSIFLGSFSSEVVFKWSALREWVCADAVLKETTDKILESSYLWDIWTTWMMSKVENILSTVHQNDEFLTYL